jgi:hypothetical protein
VLTGGGPDEAARYVAELRTALDTAAGDRRSIP